MYIYIYIYTIYSFLYKTKNIPKNISECKRVVILFVSD